MRVLGLPACFQQSRSSRRQRQVTSREKGNPVGLCNQMETPWNREHENVLRRPCRGTCRGEHVCQCQHPPCHCDVRNGLRPRRELMTDPARRTPWASQRGRRCRGLICKARALALVVYLCCLHLMLAQESGQASSGTPSPAAGQGSEDITAQLGPLNILTSGFSDSVAKPVKGFVTGFAWSFYTPGWAGSPRAFFNQLLRGEDIDCSEGAADGTACAYASFFVMLTIGFAVLLPIFTTIWCASFCCARNFVERCHCCGAPCKEPNCGSNKPTKDYEKSEKVCCSICLLFLVLIFITISLLGFLSTMQMTTDFKATLSSLTTASDFQTEMSAGINASFQTIDERNLGFADRANAFTAHGSSLTTSSESMNASLKSLITKWQDIANIVEGVTTSGRPNSCQYFINQSIPVKFDGELGMWTYNGSYPIPLPGYVCCEAVNHTNCIKGTHYGPPSGLGTMLSPSQTRSATCSTLSKSGNEITATPKTCPCCCTCQQNIEALETVSMRLPTSTRVQQVTPSISKDALSAVIIGLGTYLRKSISTYVAYVEQLKTALAPVGKALGNPTTTIAGAAGGWFFACLGAVVVFFAWTFVNVSCWWVGYCCGFMTLFLMMIMFGVTSAIVIPFGDLCLGLPVTGEDPSPWLITFSTDLNIRSVDPLLYRLHTDCLVLSNTKNPSLWNVAGYSRAQVLGLFDAFNATSILSKVDEESVTDGVANTLAFTKTKNEAKALTESSLLFWGGFSGWENEILVTVQNTDLPSAAQHKTSFSEYRTQLSQAIAAMKAGIADVEAKQATLVDVSSQLASNLTKMKAETTKSIEAIGTEVIEASNCSHLNKLYMGIRYPVCERFSKSLESMWSLFFICGFFWFPMFFVICRGNKHTQSRRGIQKVDPSMGNDSEGAGKVKKAEKEKSKAEKPKEGGGDDKKKEKKKKPKKDKGGGEKAPRASEEAMERKKAAK